MAKMNWETFNKAAKLMKKNAKVNSQSKEFFQNFPEEGYMRDNISKNMIEIKSCKSSSLRRYIKLLDNIYYSLVKEDDKQRILKKKIEIENELNNRTE